MAGFEFLVAIISALSALLLVISLLAYKRERSWRLLVTSMVFCIFLIKGLILSITIFTDNFDDLAENLTFLLSIDVIILLFLFFSLLAPPKTKEKPKIEPRNEDGKKT
jgi:hypothetical protein